MRVGRPLLSRAPKYPTAGPEATAFPNATPLIWKGRAGRVYFRGVRVVNRAGVQEAGGDNYAIRDGVVVIPKGAVLPDGTVI